MEKIKIIAGFLLIAQCVIVGFSIWLIVVGEATLISYINIIGGIAFGAINIVTITS